MQSSQTGQLLVSFSMRMKLTPCVLSVSYTWSSTKLTLRHLLSSPSKSQTHYGLQSATTTVASANAPVFVFALFVS